MTKKKNVRKRYVCLFSDCQEEAVEVRAASPKEAAKKYTYNFYRRKFGAINTDMVELVAVTTRKALRTSKVKFVVTIFQVRYGRLKTQVHLKVSRPEKRRYSDLELVTTLLRDQWEVND